MWRPIETAPKDGTRVLGWFPQRGNGFQIAVTYFENEERFSYGKRTHTLQYWYSSGFLNLHQEPSHWMPLPEAPEA
jgi:hypothetical protein